MRLRSTILVFIAAAAAAAPVSAELSGIPTETQRRVAEGGPDIPWADLIGLVGLLGLLGLRKRHPEDGYHPPAIE